MNREQMHSLGWLVSANPASSELFPKPISSTSVLYGLSFVFLRLSQSNPSESQELETHEGTPCVNPMRHAEHGDWPYQLLFLQEMGILWTVSWWISLNACMNVLYFGPYYADLGWMQKGVATPSSVYFPVSD